MTDKIKLDSTNVFVTSYPVRASDELREGMIVVGTKKRAKTYINGVLVATYEAGSDGAWHSVDKAGVENG